MSTDENRLTAFKLSVDQALLFFELCQELDLDDEPRRVALLHHLAKHGYVQNMWTTKRSKEQLIEDLADNFKVLHIKSRRAGFDTTSSPDNQEPSGGY